MPHFSFFDKCFPLSIIWVNALILPVLPCLSVQQWLTSMGEGVTSRAATSNRRLGGKDRRLVCLGMIDNVSRRFCRPFFFSRFPDSRLPDNNTESDKNVSTNGFFIQNAQQLCTAICARKAVWLPKQTVRVRQRVAACR